MDEAIVYADISVSVEASPPKDLPSVQHSDHRPCKRWHWLMLWVGLAGNIILVAAVIAMGVWGRNKNKELVGAPISSSEHISGHQYGHTGGEGNRTLEDFKSRLKEDLCVNSAESGSCRLCPLMWQKNEDRCYWFSTSIQSWEKSNEDCKAKRSQLLMGSEQEFIQKNLQVPVWIGLHLELTKKKWIWLNGSLLDQRQYQAFPLEKKHCGTLTKNKIDHEQCNQLLHWICQKKSVLI